MIDPKFDPFEMLIVLQHQVSALQSSQTQLINIITQNREVLFSLHESNKKNFELILEQAKRIEALEQANTAKTTP